VSDARRPESSAHDAEKPDSAPSANTGRGAPSRPGPLAAWTNRPARQAISSDGHDKPGGELSREARGLPPTPPMPRTSVDATFDLAPVGIMHLNKRSEPTRVNPELCELLGVPGRYIPKMRPDAQAACIVW
jgi:hypothetical protein